MLFTRFDDNVVDNEGLVNALIDAAADAFARLANIQNDVVFHRPSTGNVNSEMPCTKGSRCAGCNVPLLSLSWLCASCRGEKLTVRNSASFIRLAWKGKIMSKKLNDVGSTEWRESLKMEINFSEAFAMLKLCERILNVSESVMISARQAGQQEPNIDLRDLAVDCSSAWRRPLGTSIDEWHLSSIGLKMMSSVEECCFDWLSSIDSLLVHNLRIAQVTSEAEQAKIFKIKKDLALLIAAKMTLTESPDPKKQLAPNRLERVNRAEFAASASAALEEADATRALLLVVEEGFACAKRLLASGGESDDDDALHCFEESTEQVADLFDEATRPPEIDLQLARGSFPGSLEGLVTILRESRSPDGPLREVLGWIDVFSETADLLYLALRHARGRLELWIRSFREKNPDTHRSFFLESIRERPGRLAHEGSMPQPKWFTMTTCFDVAIRPVGAWERSGLIPKGERIVRLCSVVWQMIGAGCFENPVINISTLCRVAYIHRARSLTCCEILTQKSALANFGRDFDRAKSQVVFKDTIVEDEVAEAIACWSPFSVREIGTFFGKILPKNERKVADLVSERVPGMATSEFANFRDFIDIFLELSGLLIKDQRLKFSEPHSIRLNKRAELLRAVPRIRAWEIESDKKPSELVIPKRELRRLPMVKALLLEAASMNTLCCQRRSGTNFVFVLSTVDLEKELKG